MGVHLGEVMRDGARPARRQHHSLPVRVIRRLDHVQITRSALNYARTGELLAAVLWGIT